MTVFLHDFRYVMLEQVSKYLFICKSEDLRGKNGLIEAGITHIVSISESGILVFPDCFKYRVVSDIFHVHGLFLIKPNRFMTLSRRVLSSRRCFAINLFTSLSPCRTRPRPKYLNRKKERIS